MQHETRANGRQATRAYVRKETRGSMAQTVRRRTWPFGSESALGAHLCPAPRRARQELPLLLALSCRHLARVLASPSAGALPVRGAAIPSAGALPETLAHQIEARAPGSGRSPALEGPGLAARMPSAGRNEILNVTPASITQGLRGHYARVTQALRARLRSNYADVTQRLRNHYALDYAAITQTLRNSITHDYAIDYAIELRNSITQLIMQLNYAIKLRRNPRARNL